MCICVITCVVVFKGVSSWRKSEQTFLSEGISHVAEALTATSLSHSYSILYTDTHLLSLKSPSILCHVMSFLQQHLFEGFKWTVKKTQWMKVINKTCCLSLCVQILWILYTLKPLSDLRHVFSPKSSSNSTSNALSNDFKTQRYFYQAKVALYLQGYSRRYWECHSENNWTNIKGKERSIKIVMSNKSSDLHLAAPEEWSHFHSALFLRETRVHSLSTCVTICVYACVFLCTKTIYVMLLPQ